MIVISGDKSFSSVGFGFSVVICVIGSLPLPTTTDNVTSPSSRRDESESEPFISIKKRKGIKKILRHGVFTSEETRCYVMQEKN